MSIRIRNLQFGYSADAPVFQGLDLELPATSRVLLVGANGVGKSTLLKLLAGHHLLPRDCIELLGRSPFFDLELSREIALVDHDFPVHVDLTVEELLAHGADSVDRKREEELVRILEVNRGWRMPRISEGQRRRVQLVLAMRIPRKLLLLDEVSAHLDILARSAFLDWLKARSQADGMSILYATHILDGLESWATHLLFLGNGGRATVHEWKDVAAQPEFHSGPSPLLRLCERWMREDTPRST